MTAADLRFWIREHAVAFARAAVAEAEARRCELQAKMAPTMRGEWLRLHRAYAADAARHRANAAWLLEQVAPDAELVTPAVVPCAND
jgi:hypothetical protein